MSNTAPGVRYGEFERETAETRVRVALDFDGGHQRKISTGIGFFDHMLELFAFHGRLDIGIQCEGDRHVDDHHTIEDVGIVLGQAINHALSDPTFRIQRYADNHTPMDEALVLCAVDICGRSNLVFDVPFTREKIGEMSTECVEEFFKSVTRTGNFTLHLRKICGTNEHHIVEACFKAFGRALHDAVEVIDRTSGPASTKGSL
jgi:imidazoleglycerol-phosphate dehydratase